MLSLGDDEAWSGPVAPEKSPEELLDQVWQSELLVRAASRLEALTPPGMSARIDLSLTDEPPLGQAVVIISAQPEAAAGHVA